MTSYDREAEILEKVRQSLIAEGYDVVTEPNALLLPAFLRGYRPDALAFRSDKNLVVEVSTQNITAEKRLKKLQDLLSGQRDWGLRLVWTSKETASHKIRQYAPDIIGQTLDEVEQLLSLNQPKAALLLAWAAFEAMGRSLQPTNLAKPQTPARLVEQLATEGVIFPAEAEEARELISKRNRLIHGDLRLDVRKRDILALVKILRRLLSSLPKS